MYVGDRNVSNQASVSKIITEMTAKVRYLVKKELPNISFTKMEEMETYNELHTDTEGTNLPQVEETHLPT